MTTEALIEALRDAAQGLEAANTLVLAISGTRSVMIDTFQERAHEALTAHEAISTAGATGEVVAWLYEKKCKQSLQFERQPWLTRPDRGWTETPLYALPPTVEGEDCPHCGASGYPDILSEKSDDKVHPYRVRCTKCGCGTAWHGDYREADKAWRRRVAPPASDRAGDEGLRAVLAPECCVEFGTEPECNCPHEHWHLGHMAGSCLDVHLEDDGSAHIIFNAGDYERELSVVGVQSLDEARAMAFGLFSPALATPPKPAVVEGREG